MVVTLGLLVLALVVASMLRRGRSPHDARGVAEQIARVADGEEPQPLGDRGHDRGAARGAWRSIACSSASRA